jgi:hypothetical protein
MEKDLFRIFGGAGRNELAAIALKIGEYIEARDLPVSKRDLKINFFTMCRPPNEFEDCLNYLIDTQRVQTVMVMYGSITDTVYATPPVMRAFLTDVRAKGASLVGAIPTEMPSGSADAGSQPLVPSANPWETLNLSQVAAELPDETSVGPFLTVEPEED